MNKIEPGYGWRQLAGGETILVGDEWFNPSQNMWLLRDTVYRGERFYEGVNTLHRRRIDPGGPEWEIVPYGQRIIAGDFGLTRSDGWIPVSGSIGETAGNDCNGHLLAIRRRKQPAAISDLGEVHRSNLRAKGIGVMAPEMFLGHPAVPTIGFAPESDDKPSWGWITIAPGCEMPDDAREVDTNLGRIYWVESQYEWRAKHFVVDQSGVYCWLKAPPMPKKPKERDPDEQAIKAWEKHHNAKFYEAEGTHCWVSGYNYARANPPIDPAERSASAIISGQPPK